jgi:hypothetical protein
LTTRALAQRSNEFYQIVFQVEISKALRPPQTLISPLRSSQRPTPSFPHPLRPAPKAALKASRQKKIPSSSNIINFIEEIKK